MTEQHSVDLSHFPVELFKILKFEGIAASGAEAKIMIDNGQVEVNGEIETRKRRQIVPGDIIKIAQLELHVRSL